MRLPRDDLTPELRDRLVSIRLVVCDVDGTLLTSDHQVTQRTAAAVAAARAAGVEVMLASSRAPGALRPILDALETAHTAVLSADGGVDVGDATSPPFISSQGALLGRYVDGELQALSHRPAPLDAAHAVLAAAVAERVSVGWYRLDDWLVPDLGQAARPHREDQPDRWPGQAHVHL